VHICPADGRAVLPGAYRAPWVTEVYHVGRRGLSIYTKAARGRPRTVLGAKALTGRCGAGWEAARLIRAAGGRRWVLAQKRPPKRGNLDGGIRPMQVGPPPPDFPEKLLVVEGGKITEAASWTRRAIGLFGHEPGVHIVVSDDGASASLLFVDYGFQNRPKPPSFTPNQAPKVHVVRVDTAGKQTRIDLDGASLGRGRWKTTLPETTHRVPRYRVVAADADSLTLWTTDERRVTRKAGGVRQGMAMRPTDAVSTSFRRDGTAIFGFQVGRLVRVNLARKMVTDLGGKLTHGLDVPAEYTATGGVMEFADACRAKGLIIFRVRKHSHRNRPATGLAIVRPSRTTPAK